MWNYQQELKEPITAINTENPVKMVRYSVSPSCSKVYNETQPFGRNTVLSIFHRGDNSLKLWCLDNPSQPCYSFQGHMDTVSEFVWRRTSCNTSSLYVLFTFVKDDDQLISWSRDSTIRIWPINKDLYKVSPSLLLKLM